MIDFKLNHKKMISSYNIEKPLDAFLFGINLSLPFLFFSYFFTLNHAINVSIINLFLPLFIIKGEHLYFIMIITHNIAAIFFALCFYAIK